MAVLIDGYYSGQNFHNSILALDIAIENHFGSMLFSGDLQRIVYASNGYALRKRAQKEAWSNANLPFLNYRMSGIENGGARSLWTARGNMAGRYFDDLGYRVRYTPVTVAYEASVWVQRHDEMMVAAQEILWDDSNETVLEADLAIDGNTFKIPGFLGYSIDVDPQYDESDWLERNKIHTISMNLEIQTYILKSNEQGFWVPETVLFNFAANKGASVNTYSEAREFAVEATT